MRREIARTARDPMTGIVLGAEELELSPPVGVEPRGEACLLLHGFCGSPADFADLPEQLAARGFDVRVPRLPGHGTTPPDFAYQPDGAILAKTREEYRRLRQRFQTVHVIGFSMGGALAARLSAEEDVARLVLAAPYFGVSYRWYYILPPEWWQRMLGWAIPYAPKFKPFTCVKKRESIGRFFSYFWVPTAGSRQLMRLGAEARAHGVLERIDCPVLHLHSPSDRAASPSAAQKAFDRIGSKAKRQVWLANSDHVLFWDCDAEQAKSEILGFLLSYEGPSRME
ncbi:MAG: Thermostable monoacylglycerol lipase [candidate division BRC1 bacterium ADurb.BinA364]|nr:MAG: Thermostable monoacylglycerol lipase [candidate division BRC1 bacterium ADurb.BinA364]